MKITDSEIIKSGEKELLDAITADLDWGAVEEIFIKDHGLKIEEDIEFQKGDIVSYEDQIAYQLEFSVKIGLSVLLDREGNYLSVAVSGNQDKSEIHDEDTAASAPENDIEVQTGSDEDNVAGINIVQEEKPPEEIKDDYQEALAELDSPDIPSDSELMDMQASQNESGNSEPDQGLHV